jgi:histidine triad (HIT) family protein
MMIQNLNCIFCKIISGKEPSSKVYEDEDILAFLDLRPINPGELLIIPKEHIDHFYDVPDEIATKIIILAQKLAKKIKEKFNPLRVGYVVHGFGVPHAHFVLVPLNKRDDITSARFMRIEDGKIIINFEQVPFQTRGELDRVAELLKED